MAISSYNELQAAVLRWLARDDLSDTVPDLIALGEQRLYRGATEPFPSDPLRVWQMLGTGSFPVLDGGIVMSSHLELRAVHLDGEPVRTLDATSPDALVRLQPHGAVGAPRLYAVEPTATGTQLTFRPALPDGAPVTLQFYDLPRPLSAAEISLGNDLLAAYPQLYLYAALVEAAPFLLEDGRLPLWHGLLKGAVEGANRSDARRRRGAGISIMRPLGATP